MTTTTDLEIDRYTLNVRQLKENAFSLVATHHSYEIQTKMADLLMRRINVPTFHFALILN